MSFKVNNITKKYSSHKVLKEISFEISFGRCIGILGVNGSGKSTLLSILAGVQKADSGSFMYEDTDLLKDMNKHAETVGYVPQGTPLIEELTARDNLLLWYTKEQLKKELDKGVLSMLDISGFLDKTVSKLSGGMKKRLSIGCSMSGHPRILLLDEPSAAIDIVCKKNIADYVNMFKKSGGSVIITTHDVTELELCDEMYILKDGVLSRYNFDGDLDRLTENLK